MIYLDLFLTFLKIGAFTFGGGYAMLPLIEEEVISHKWMSLSEVIDFVAVSESTPGPFAINMATFIGTKTGGFFGAVCATLGVVLPSFVIILIIAKFYQKFKNSKGVKYLMNGLKPAAIGLIASAVVTVALAAFFPFGFSITFFKDLSFYAYLLIFAVCGFLIIKKVHPIPVICISAALGIAFGYLQQAF